ncbi:hypothetical protein L1049_003892 [Liquidambar formosana]|uniref:Uncharacterized protein n=1 Tax=Liquidambar formosana TaxID=63359 RepID=A0AAP0RME0_LIQFO
MILLSCCILLKATLWLLFNTFCRGCMECLPARIFWLSSLAIGSSIPQAYLHFSYSEGNRAFDVLAKVAVASLNMEVVWYFSPNFLSPVLDSVGGRATSRGLACQSFFSAHYTKNSFFSV